MPNPAPRSCEVQDCEYKTPTGLTSHEQQFQDIRLHLVMAHPQVAAALAAINNPVEAGGSQSSVKAEKLSRPYLEGAVKGGQAAWQEGGKQLREGARWAEDNYGDLASTVWEEVSARL